MRTLLQILFAFCALPYLSLACSGCIAAREAAANPFALGTDPPAPPATLGYTLNHFSLTANDLDGMVTFYRDVLGMRLIFTYAASPTTTIVYLGYSHGGKNGTGYQTGAELYKEKNNSEGLLELVCPNATVNTNGDPPPAYVPSTKVPNTFSHIGLIVPDIEAAQRRMVNHNVNILKPTGEKIKWGSDAASAFGFDETHSTVRAARAALAGIASIGFNSFMLITDPDGNLIEVQQQEPVPVEATA